MGVGLECAFSCLQRERSSSVLAAREMGQQYRRRRRLVGVLYVKVPAFVADEAHAWLGLEFGARNIKSHGSQLESTEAP